MAHNLLVTTVLLLILLSFCRGEEGTPAVTDRSTRQSEDFHIGLPNVRPSPVSRCCSLEPAMFNSLPGDLKALKAEKSFKNKLKSYLVEREKITIHIPYKIQHHHHTHTNYKIITVPADPKARDDAGEQTTLREIETSTEAVAPSSSSSTEAAQLNKYRTYVKVKETSNYPILEYLGLNKLFGIEKKAPHKLEVIHEEPVVEHLIHTPWKTQMYGYHEEKEMKKYEMPTHEGYQYPDPALYGHHQYGQYDSGLQSTGLQQGTGLEGTNYDGKFTEDNYAKFSVQKPVYETPYPMAKARQSVPYILHEKNEKEAGEVVQKIIQKHIYAQFPAMKKPKNVILKPTLRHSNLAQGSAGSVSGKAQLDMSQIAMSKQSPDFEHVGFIVMGEDNTPKFVGVGKDAAS